MSRPPKFTHPLRAARKILQLPQHELGKRIGYSRLQIINIENGRLGMSDEAASRIRVTFGIDTRDMQRDPKELKTDYANEAPKPRTLDGEPYSKEFYDTEWKQRRFPSTSQTAKREFGLIAPMIGALMLAATRDGARQLPGVYAALLDVIWKIRDDFQLEKQFAAVCSEINKKRKYPSNPPRLFTATGAFTLDDIPW